MTAGPSLKYWVGFNLVPGIGPVRFRRLLDFFGEAERAWHASPREWAAAGLDARAVESLVAGRARVDLEAELEKVWRRGVKVLTWEDSTYPPRLREIPSSPPVLYVRGTLEGRDEWAVGIVGTRRATAYGREMASRLANDLARSQVTVVSGLAKGIDGVAHRAALAAGGRTIAVLGCGVDVVYPPEHLKLTEAVVEGGALVSDYPVGTPPEAGNFPARNRIISGLSLGVVVVEAGESSGALISAASALDQNREVFAVPGSVLSPLSRGSNRLIQQGAKLVMDCRDILEELSLQMVGQQMEMKELLPTTEDEAKLLHLLRGGPLHIDEVCRGCGLPIAVVSSNLAMMELKGMVRQIGGMNYALAR